MATGSLAMRQYRNPLLPNLGLPLDLLQADERTILAQNGYDLNSIGCVNEKGKALLPLRDTSEAHTQTSIYHRR